MNIQSIACGMVFKPHPRPHRNKFNLYCNEENVF
jgi:hypothetical protein